jgi:RNA polymerase sigma factor (sigma-70 family)
MNHTVEFKGFDPKDTSNSVDEIRKLIENRIAKLDRKIRRLSAGALFLRVLVERNPAHKLYNVSATFELPGKSLAAKDEKHDPASATKETFREMERQLEDYKATLRKEHLWKRLAKREELRQQKVNAAAAHDHETFFSLIGPHLNALHDFVGHVLDFAEARGDLPRGQLTIDDVVDEALIRAYREFSESPARADIGSWLIHVAGAQIQTEVKRRKWERGHTVRIEEDIPETPPMEEVSSLGDEILDFYQPDEDLKLEDIVPDIETPSPEQEAEQQEMRQTVRTALKGMPGEWRRALMLRYVDGLEGAELSKSVGKPSKEVDRLLDYARGYFRERLIDAGCRFRTEGSSAYSIFIGR